MDKPNACYGCPMYQGGDGYVADELAEDALVLYVAQNPGKEEVEAGRCLVGPTGKMLNDQFLPRTGEQRGTRPGFGYVNDIPVWTTTGGRVSCANIIRCRWEKTNDLPPKDVLDEAIRHCRQFDVIQPTVRVIVAGGQLATDVLTDGVGPVTEWRGDVLVRKTHETVGDGRDD